MFSSKKLKRLDRGAPRVIEWWGARTGCWRVHGTLWLRLRSWEKVGVRFMRRLGRSMERKGTRKWMLIVSISICQIGEPYSPESSQLVWYMHKFLYQFTDRIFFPFSLYHFIICFCLWSYVVNSNVLFVWVLLWNIFWFWRYCCFLGHFVGLNHRLVFGSSFIDYAKRLVRLLNGCSFFLYRGFFALRGFLTISYFYVSIFSHSEFFSFIKNTSVGFP